MKLRLEWMRPLALADASRQNLIYSFDYSKLPEACGVYVFGRRYGKQFEALYVGKAGELRSRTKGQLNNLRLMRASKECKEWQTHSSCGAFHP
jgi:hypothetical protein